MIVKQTAADMDVAWEPHPRVAFELMPATMPSHATANTLIDLIVGTVTIDPDRYYHVFAGVRCIQDPGAVVCLAQFQVKCGVDLQGYDVVATPDTGLWGVVVAELAAQGQPAQRQPADEVGGVQVAGDAQRRRTEDDLQPPPIHRRVLNQANPGSTSRK